MKYRKYLTAIRMALGAYWEFRRRQITSDEFRKRVSDARVMIGRAPLESEP
jgi:hypothetical protein